jgi:bifunctional non-homologous end joining protein LigD
MASVTVPDFQAQLATLVEAPPEGDSWLHEQKFDGYRIGLRKDGRLLELWSRRGQNWTAQFPALAAAGAKLATRRALRAETPYRHDRVVFDFDPGPDVARPAVVAAARLVRQLLNEQKLRSWVKTTGVKGLHVVVPISPADGAACLAFAQAVAQALVGSDARRFTTSSVRVGRESRILVDVLRNGRANTSVAAYPLRARPGATVSTPLDWDELGPRLDPARFTLQAAVARSRQADPWAGYWSARQKLPSV